MKYETINGVTILWEAGETLVMSPGGDILSVNGIFLDWMRGLPPGRIQAGLQEPKAWPKDSIRYVYETTNHKNSSLAAAFRYSPGTPLRHKGEWRKKRFQVGDSSYFSSDGIFQVVVQSAKPNQPGCWEDFARESYIEVDRWFEIGKRVLVDDLLAEFAVEVEPAGKVAEFKLMLSVIAIGGMHPDTEEPEAAARFEEKVRSILEESNYFRGRVRVICTATKGAT